MSNKKDEDLKSFQIGNLTPPSPAGAPPLGAPPKPTTPATTTNNDSTEPAERVYPNIEELLESEDLEVLGSKMGETCDKLDEIIAKRSGTAKLKAQQARKAYDHTFDLIDHLMQIKQEMLDNPEE